MFRIKFKKTKWKKYGRFFIVTWILGVVLAVIFLKTHHRTTQILNPTPQIIFSGEPPEIKQLLAETDKVKQAVIVRAMAKKYGPKQALVYMEHSGLPYTGETHLLVHQIGNAAYQKYGDKALLYCDESFLAACYHGVVLNELADNGIGGLAKMIESCKAEGPQIIAQCSHAAGHGFLALEDYKVLQALPLCDHLNQLEPSAPAFNCYDGVFMENIFGVHEGVPSPNRMVKASDPNYPCDAVPEKYKGGCWADQATLMYELFKGDLRKVAQGCDSVKNSDYKRICYNNFAREIHPITQGDASVAMRLCQNATGEWKDECLITLVDAAFSVGDTKAMPYSLCAEMVNSPEHDKCYQEIYNNIQTYASSKDLMAEYCGYIKEDKERAECGVKFNVITDVSNNQNSALTYSSSEFKSAAPDPEASSDSSSLQDDADKIKSIAKSQGVVAAYNYLKQNWGANPVRGHDLAHIIGQLAYEQKGIKGFALCDSAFGFGCYHGLMEILVKDEGNHGVTEARQGCEGLPLQGQVVSCLHGIGHGVMADSSNVESAVKECKTFPVAEQPYCYDGSFMEYYTGVMKIQGKNLKVDFSKPWDLCSTFSIDAQYQCIRNATFFLLYSGTDTFTPLTQACDKLSLTFKPVCLQTAGLYSAQMANGSTDVVQDFCKKFKTLEEQSTCLSAAAQEFIFENKSKDQAESLCSNLDADWKQKCNQSVQQMLGAYGGK